MLSFGGGSLEPAEGLESNFCDRTPQIQDVILDKLSVHYPSITCDAVNRTHLETLQYVIVLKDLSISELKDIDFDGLSNIRTINLDDNNLSSLPDGVFDSLIDLEGLFLGNNDLVSLPDGVFDNAKNLKTLYLQDNNLTVLPDGVFDETG